jgi:molecular chaperone GrpE (heat shock protein)
LPYRHPPNRSDEYRRRADEARQKADATKDEETQKALLETADTWERMAEYEDKHNPPRPGSG